MGDSSAVCLVSYQRVSSALYHEIVEHRRKFYHVGYVDYDKEQPANIQIVPNEDLMPAYEADYNEMKTSSPRAIRQAATPRAITT